MERCKIRLQGYKIILISVRSSFRAQGVYSLRLGLASLKLPHSVHQKPSEAFPGSAKECAGGRKAERTQLISCGRGFDITYYHSHSHTYIFSSTGSLWPHSSASDSFKNNFNALLLVIDAYIVLGRHKQ